MKLTLAKYEKNTKIQFRHTAKALTLVDARGAWAKNTISIKTNNSDHFNRNKKLFGSYLQKKYVGFFENIFVTEVQMPS